MLIKMARKPQTPITNRHPQRELADEARLLARATPTKEAHSETLKIKANSREEKFDFIFLSKPI